jgi:hypothetical protein
VDDQGFAEILTLCQFMPGPNIVGITTCVGSRPWAGRSSRRCGRRSCAAALPR